MKCPTCGKEFRRNAHLIQHQVATRHVEGVETAPSPPPDPDVVPDWGSECENCGDAPVVPLTGLCGPCTFGTAGARDGNW